MVISYIMFAYMGIAFLSQGTLKLEMADSFGITTSELQYMFTFFATASMITVIANKIFLERVPLKVEVILSSVFILVGTFFMILTKSINIFMIGLILSGLGIGIYISDRAIGRLSTLINRSTDEQPRIHRATHTSSYQRERESSEQ